MSFYLKVDDLALFNPNDFPVTFIKCVAVNFKLYAFIWVLVLL
jgi:hypothetical protein